VAGENFWLIARSHLQELWQRSPSNREVARFWLDLIAANRARLQSGDPDLIFPGEVFELPEAGPGA
jgi:nucleoid-associated protein YgaU